MASLRSFTPGGSTSSTNLFADDLVVSAMAGDKGVTGQEAIVSGHCDWQVEAAGKNRRHSILVTHHSCLFLYNICEFICIILIIKTAP